MTFDFIVPLVPQPCNILVQDSQGGGAVKLVDFGAARHFGCSQQMLPLEKVYETPSSYYYMSPEVFQQQPLAGPADIWSVCVLLTIYSFPNTFGTGLLEL